MGRMGEYVLWPKNYIFVIDITQLRYQLHSLRQKSHILLKKTGCKREL
jgi:hypothetical protein